MWRFRRSTEERRGRGERSRRRDVSTFLREPLGLAAFSAGSTLGAARPQTCAKESSTLWTLLALRRGRVSAYTRRRHPGTRRDPPESNLCSGGSGCISMLPTRANVQTRAAPKRRGVGLRARSGVKAALRPLWTLFFGFAVEYLLPNIAITAILEPPHPRPQHPGTRKDLTGSDLWPVRSCCISMLPTRANVQTRSAPKR